MKTYGSVRVSTLRQDPQRQINNILRQYPDAIIYSDKYTGTSLNRPEFQKMLKQIDKDLERGEEVTIVFDEVSRMSRNAEEGFRLYQDLYNKGITLVFLKEGYLNTESYRKALNGSISVDIQSGDKATDDLLQSIITALNKFIMAKVQDDISRAFESAQAEVDRLHIRTSEGMKTAGAVNRTDADGNVLEYGSIAQSKLGKHPIHQKSKEAIAVIKKHSKDFGGSLTDKEVMQMTSLARNTYYKIKKQIKQSMDA